jgi:hypothetical protein
VADDSGGADPEVLTLHSEDTHVVTTPFNLGHQRALVFALRRIRPLLADLDIVITLDADGEDRPEDIPRLITSLLAPPTTPDTVTLAVRKRRQDTLSFRLLYHVFRLAFRFLTGVSVRTGNYAAYRGRFVRHVLAHPYFDLSYSSALVAIVRDPRFVTCDRGNRYAGHSQMNYSMLVIHGVRMLMPFSDRIAIRALITFSIVFLFGIIASICILFIKLFSQAAIPGWASITLLLVLSLSFMALGNFIVLFAVFSQSQGISLSGIEAHDEYSS